MLNTPSSFLALWFARESTAPENVIWGKKLILAEFYGFSGLRKTLLKNCLGIFITLRLNLINKTLYFVFFRKKLFKKALKFLTDDVITEVCLILKKWEYDFWLFFFFWYTLKSISNENAKAVFPKGVVPSPANQIYVFEALSKCHPQGVITTSKIDIFWCGFFCSVRMTEDFNVRQ